MRLVLSLGLCLLISACSTGNSLNRTYVISKSHEAAAEPVDEQTTEELSD